MTKKIKLSISLRFPSGDYTIKDYTFNDQKHYDNWFDKRIKDNSLGKVIGVFDTIKPQKKT